MPLTPQQHITRKSLVKSPSLSKETYYVSKKDLLSLVKWPSIPSCWRTHPRAGADIKYATQHPSNCLESECWWQICTSNFSCGGHSLLGRSAPFLIHSPVIDFCLLSKLDIASSVPTYVCRFRVMLAREKRQYTSQTHRLLLLPSSSSLPPSPWRSCARAVPSRAKNI